MVGGILAPLQDSMENSQLGYSNSPCIAFARLLFPPNSGRPQGCGRAYSQRWDSRCVDWHSAANRRITPRCTFPYGKTTYHRLTKRATTSLRNRRIRLRRRRRNGVRNPAKVAAWVAPANNRLVKNLIQASYRPGRGERNFRRLGRVAVILERNGARLQNFDTAKFNSNDWTMTFVGEHFNHPDNWIES